MSGRADTETLQREIKHCEWICMAQDGAALLFALACVLAFAWLEGEGIL